MTVRIRRRPDVLWRRSLDAVVLLPAGADDVLTLAEHRPGRSGTCWRSGAPSTIWSRSSPATSRPNPRSWSTTSMPLLAELEAQGALEVAADSGGPQPE